MRSKMIGKEAHDKVDVVAGVVDLRARNVEGPRDRFELVIIEMRDYIPRKLHRAEPRTCSARDLHPLERRNKHTVRIEIEVVSDPRMIGHIVQKTGDRLSWRNAMLQEIFSGIAVDGLGSRIYGYVEIDQDPERIAEGLPFTHYLRGDFDRIDGVTQSGCLGVYDHPFL